MLFIYHDFMNFIKKISFAFNFDVGHSYWEQNEVL